MKKIYILLFAIILMGNNVQSQDENITSYEKGFYGRVAAGYNFGLCYYDPCCYYDESNYSPSYDIVKKVDVKWGSGLNVELAGGYKFNKYLGVDLAVRDFYGCDFKTTADGGGAETYFTETTKYRAMVLGLNPSVIITPGFDNFNPYAKIGVDVGVFPQVYKKETNTQGSATGGSTTYSYQGVYYGHIPVGFTASGGVEWNFADNMNIYAEVNYFMMNYSPAHYKLTKYSENGVDKLGDLFTKDKRIDFVKSFDKTETIPNDSPNKQLKITMPLEGVGIQFGYTLKF